ncbi:MAG: hypothetical protein WC628_07580 [Candidatus Omnitrophota bacterium]
MNGKTKEKFDLSKHRVITMLNREEVEFMDKMGKDALFSAGHKLSYNVILKGLLDVAMDLGVSGENIDSLATFKERLLVQIRSLVQKQIEQKG